MAAGKGTDRAIDKCAFFLAPDDIFRGILQARWQTARMHIAHLEVTNFRGIRHLRLANLETMVIVAGQNGSGKSCIFDAVRLLKSVYGGYQANEWQHWMGEFQLNVASSSADFVPIFNDPRKEIQIVADFKLAASERDFLSTNASDLLREKIWRTTMPEAYGWGRLRFAMFASQFREREPEVSKRVETELPRLLNELSQENIRGIFRIAPGELPKIADSLVLSVVFGTFRPQELGVIDFHGAQRHYGRENVQGINLNLDASEQQQSQSALYNYSAKYANVKGEMAASFIKELLAEKAGVLSHEQATLSSTLKELFETFFPDKQFLGPRATRTGTLSFPVQIAGMEHDLDDLSSGEKEILYGYLRIRNSAPRHSIILLDEPELHLNPRLVRGLPQFYRKNLGEALNNQIWLVTHSDALLREVVGNQAYAVYHMLPAVNVGSGDNQVKQLSATTDLDVAIADMVGDLASYRPGAMIVVLEGGGDTDFDKRVVSSLFPELCERANVISGTNKVRVRGLMEILERAEANGTLPFEVYSVTDRDNEATLPASNSRRCLCWDAYHIENYFLEPRFICAALSAIQGTSPEDESLVVDELRECAKETLPQLIRHELSEFANTHLRDALNLRTNALADDPSGALVEAIARSVDRAAVVRDGQLSLGNLTSKEQEIRSRFDRALADGTWIKEFRGREILRRFVSKRKLQPSYEVFRNIVLSQMKSSNHRPTGMKLTIEKILPTRSPG
jgi:hypothetical protein